MLEAENICKRYFRKTGQANFFEAVKPVSVTLKPGEVVMLTGRSGSGKTTLLHLLSGLLRPTEGTVRLDGTDLYGLRDEALSRLRNQRLGVIPQARSAVDSLTVLENILLPSQLYHPQDRQQEALRWMRELGIDDLRDARTAELSGGELRRMAIARTLTQRTDYIFADEPTGDLDDENTRRVLEILQTVARKEGRGVLLVTHEEAAASYADRVMKMDLGAVSVAPAPSQGTLTQVLAT